MHAAHNHFASISTELKSLLADRNRAIQERNIGCLCKCTDRSLRLMAALLEAGYANGAQSLWDVAVAELVLARDKVRSSTETNRKTLDLLATFWNDNACKYCEVDSLKQIVLREEPIDDGIVEAQLVAYNAQVQANARRVRDEHAAGLSFDPSPVVGGDIW